MRGSPPDGNGSGSGPESRWASAKAVEIANKIAACGPLGIKTSLASSHMALEDFRRRSLSSATKYSALLTTRDFQEGRDAEAQERPPVYEGR